MGLRGQPGVVARDIVKAQPLVWEEPDDPDVDVGLWVPSGRAIEVYPVKAGSAESFREGKQNQQVSYTLYADHHRGVRFPLGEKDRIWLEEAGVRNPDGSPDYSTALTIDSVVTHNQGRIAIIEAGRES